MTAPIVLIPCLADNYGALIHDPATGATASVDAPEAVPILKALETAGWKLTHILVTHHHADHVQGVERLKAVWPGAVVIGPKAEADRIPLIERVVEEGDVVKIGSLAANVIATPGHTLGHVVYHFADEAVLFAGDTLFAMGCGRPFEAPAATLWDSLRKLRGLDPLTRIYCGHEYTLANGRFALSVEPDNADVQARLLEVKALRADGAPTIPTTLALEERTNPFLRADSPEIKRALGMSNAADADAFAELRLRKNRS